MALRIERLTLGGHNGLPPLVPQQTDWCKASQSPSSVNWEKNISQARDRGDLQQFQPHLAHLRHFNMFSSEDTISMWCQMGRVRRKNHFTCNSLHQDLSSTFLILEHFFTKMLYIAKWHTHAAHVSHPHGVFCGNSRWGICEGFSHTFTHSVLHLQKLPVWQD